jgi:hypothetical protein
MSLKGSFGNIGLFHKYLVVSKSQIKFGKELSTTQLIQKFNNDRNGEFIFDGNFFQGSKIRAHVIGALFLEYHEKRRGIRSSTRMDNTRH